MRDLASEEGPGHGRRSSRCAAAEAARTAPCARLPPPGMPDRPRHRRGLAPGGTAAAKERLSPRPMDYGPRMATPATPAAREPGRPDPEALLAIATREGRGRLKVF